MELAFQKRFMRLTGTKLLCVQTNSNCSGITRIFNTVALALMLTMLLCQWYTCKYLQKIEWNAVGEQIVLCSKCSNRFGVVVSTVIILLALLCMTLRHMNIFTGI